MTRIPLAYACLRSRRRIVVLRVHERVEADAAGRISRSGSASCAATTDWLDDLTVEKARIAIIICGTTCKLHLASLRIATERHHKTLDVTLANASLLVHLLNQLSVLSILLQQDEALLVLFPEDELLAIFIFVRIFEASKS